MTQDLADLPFVDPKQAAYFSQSKIMLSLICDESLAKIPTKHFERRRALGQHKCAFGIFQFLSDSTEFVEKYAQV